MLWRITKRGGQDVYVEGTQADVGTFLRATGFLYGSVTDVRCLDRPTHKNGRAVPSNRAGSHAPAHACL